MSHDAYIVVKVGGSLFDWPELGEHLNAWLGRLKATKVLIVPGGGAPAEAVRSLDNVHHLGEEAAHWLAIQAMSLNARFLQELLPSARIVGDVELFANASGTEAGWFILDALPFFRADDARSDRLPHDWNVSSDSLTVRAAVLVNAGELILLKSVTGPGDDWAEAARAGLVDGFFVAALKQAPTTMRVRLVNLRTAT